MFCSSYERGNASAKAAQGSAGQSCDSWNNAGAHNAGVLHLWKHSNFQKFGSQLYTPNMP